MVNNPVYICIEAVWDDDNKRTDSMRELANAIRSELGGQYAKLMLDMPKVTVVIDMPSNHA
jgi:hypothetical protein